MYICVYVYMYMDMYIYIYTVIMFCPNILQNPMVYHPFPPAKCYFLGPPADLCFLSSLVVPSKIKKVCCTYFFTGLQKKYMYVYIHDVDV